MDWSQAKHKIFQNFGSKCYILRDRENLTKFDSRSNEGIFLGYSLTSKAYRVFHLKNFVVMESINVVVDDASTSDYFSDDDEGMTFSPSFEQVMDKNMESPSDPESETEKKILANEENVDLKKGSSEIIVPKIIRQFEEKSASKSSTSVSKIQQTASSPVPHPRS